MKCLCDKVGLSFDQLSVLLIMPDNRKYFCTNNYTGAKQNKYSDSRLESFIYVVLELRYSYTSVGSTKRSGGWRICYNIMLDDNCNYIL